MPVELVEKGVKVARERTKCPYCGNDIKIKFNVKTGETMYVHGASDPEDGVIQCYECKAKLQWTPPKDI